MKLKNTLAGILAAVALAAGANDERLELKFNLGNKSSKPVYLNYSSATNVTSGFDSGFDKVMQSSDFPADNQPGIYIIQTSGSTSWPIKDAYVPNNAYIVRVPLTFKGTVSSQESASASFSLKHLNLLGNPRQFTAKLYDSTGTNLVYGPFVMGQDKNTVMLPQNFFRTNEVSAAATPRAYIEMLPTQDYLPMGMTRDSSNNNLIVYNFPANSTGAVQRTTNLDVGNSWTNVGSLTSGDSVTNFVVTDAATNNLGAADYRAFYNGN